MIDNLPVYGPVAVSSESDIVQNSDGTHWFVEPKRAEFADFLGSPLRGFICPPASDCSITLDEVAKRVYVISKLEKGSDLEIRELTRSGAFGVAYPLTLPSTLEGLAVHAISTSGGLIWVRATLSLRGFDAVESVLALDTRSGLQRQWTLEPRSTAQRSLSGARLQFAAADRSLTVVEKINDSTGEKLSVRRFEFNPSDAQFVDGFE